jgi:hypothetical protein
MASAGTVTLDLDANSVKLLQELQKAQRRTRTTANSMAADFGKAFAGISKAAVAAGAVFAGVVTKMTVDGLKAVDANAKLARSLDGTVDGLQALQIAASDAGIQGLESSLTRLNRNLGAAAMGAGPAAKTVEALGINLKEIQRLDVDQKIAYIGQRIQEAGVSSQEAARHLQRLGFDQAQALALFRDGGASVQAYREEVQKLGLSVSEIDAAKIEQANDRFSRFGFWCAV